MNTEETRTGTNTRLLEGKAVGPNTLTGAAQTLRKLADALEAIDAENPVPLHWATLAWDYDAGASCDVGRGVVTYTLKTWTTQ